MLKNLFSSYVLYPLAEKYLKRDIKTKTAFLRDYYKQSFAYREAIVKQALYDQLCLAATKVPYYRDLFKAIKFDVDKIKNDVKFMQEIPFLDKNIILEQGSRLMVEDFATKKMFPCKTGGSSGKTVIINYDQAAADWSAATTLYARALCGNTQRKKECHLSSEMPFDQNNRDRFIERMKCLSMNRRNVYYRRFTPNDMQNVLSEIRKANTHLVHCHPSTMYSLALEYKKQNKAKKIFSVFESSGEYLSPQKSKLIQSVFQCDVINRYGLAEAGVIAYQTGEDIDTLKLFDHMVWPESVLGELVMTNLKNQLMPLIRYKTGDLADVEITTDGITLKNLRGRVHDAVNINGTTYYTHYIQDILDRIGGVVEFQVVQKSEQEAVLKIVPEANLNKSHFENEIHRIWNGSLPVNYISHDQLTLVGRRHKFRYVVDA